MGRLLLAPVIILLALLPSAASACGIPLNARIASERALLVFDGQSVSMTTSMGLEPTEPNAAVIFPVPAAPEVDQPVGGDQLFTYLEQATAPLIQVEQRYRWGFEPPFEAVGSGLAPGGVAVLGRETLGGYDVARLTADDPQALNRWLTENGFTLPEGAEPILAAYVAEGWSFVAVRLAPDAPGGSLAPLRMRYPATELIYPMRLDSLSDQVVGIDLYIVANYRVEIDRLDTAFAGALTLLEPPPAAELTTLLSGATYLTKLTTRDLDPDSINSDFIARKAASDEPYREVITRYEDVWVFSTFGPLIAMLIVVVGLSAGTLYGAFILRRRMQEIEPKEQ
jgi:hypothetical protein